MDDVLSWYFESTNKQMAKHLGNSILQTSNRRGIGKVRFTEVVVLDSNGRKTKKLPYGAYEIIIKAKYKAEERIKAPIFSVAIRDAKQAEHIFIARATTSVNNRIEELSGEGEFLVKFNLPMLAPNLYGIYACLNDGVVFNLTYDVWDINGTTLEIVKSDKFFNDKFRVTYPYISAPYEIIHNKSTVTSPNIGGEAFAKE